MNFLVSICQQQWSEARFASIFIDKGIADYLLSLREKCKGIFDLESFYGVCFRNYMPDVYSDSGDDRVDPSVFDVIESPEGYVPDEKFGMNVDFSILVVKPDGILWKCYIEHSDEVAETENIPWKTIEEIK